MAKSKCTPRRCSANKRRATKRTAKHSNTKSSLARIIKRARIPPWAQYFLPGPDWEAQYRALMHRTDDVWRRFCRSCRDAWRARTAAKAARPPQPTPKRARELRAGGLAAFVARKQNRPRADTGFTAAYRRKHPEVLTLDSKGQRRAVERARSKTTRRTARVRTSHVTSVASAALNVPLLESWLALDLDPAPALTKKLLKMLRKEKCAWKYWRSGGGMGRLWAEPWPSLASVNTKARAVVCHERAVGDLDMSACHHRIALAKARRYGVSEVGPLERYVANPKAMRDDVESRTQCGKGAAKLVYVILLNGGSVATWTNVCRETEGAVPDIPADLYAELLAFRDCCLKIRDVVLARERSSFPKALRRASPSRRWSFAMSAVEDRALRAIWRAVEKLGASVIMLVYDGLMLLLNGAASQDELAAAATKAATAASGCEMPTRFKPMKLPPAMREIIRLRQQIADRDATIAEREATITELRRELAAARRGV